jgi:hypothetical protein
MSIKMGHPALATLLSAIHVTGTTAHWIQTNHNPTVAPPKPANATGINQHFEFFWKNVDQFTG